MDPKIPSQHTHVLHPRLLEEYCMKGYRTKKIALPGGRVIEVVYLADPADPNSRSDETVAASENQSIVAVIGNSGLPELHICPKCGSDLVHPVSWEERQDDMWRIKRRCPNCEWHHSGDFDQDAVELFDDVLNDGMEYLLVSLRNFARSNMEEDVERLIELIMYDRILPFDF